MLIQTAGPTPADADYSWPDEHIVPQYIKIQTDLMKLIASELQHVRPGS